jgi:TolB-like protein
MRTILAAAAVFVCATASAELAILPFEDSSGSPNARPQVAKLIENAVRSKGWRIATTDIAPILEKERVRYVDSLDPAVRTRILDATESSAFLSGAIYTYSDSRIPVVALSARLVGRNGKVLWSNVIGVSADDTEGLFGFGRKTGVDAVAADAVAMLMRDFPQADTSSPGLPAGPRKPLLHTRPISYRSPDIDATDAPICVLPFENLSSAPEASRIVADVLALRLATERNVIEPAVMRSAALAARIGSFRNIASRDLEALAESLGTPLFLRGTVYSFATTGEARFHVEMSLVDIKTGRVLWAAQHVRKGSDYIGFLMQGNVSNAVSLTDRVVSEMIVGLEKRNAKNPVHRVDRAGRVASLRR